MLLRAGVGSVGTKEREIGTYVGMKQGGGVVCEYEGHTVYIPTAHATPMGKRGCRNMGYMRGHRTHIRCRGGTVHESHDRDGESESMALNWGR